MKDNKRKRYPESFKKEALMRVMGQNSSTHSVYKELSISQPTLSKWVKKFKEQVSSVFSEEDAKVKQLRAKVKRDERDILKKAVTFFAKHDG